MKKVFRVRKGEYTNYIDYPLVSDDLRSYSVIFDTGITDKNLTFLVTAIRPDGKKIKGVGTASGGVCEYTLESNMYSVEGELKLRLTVSDDSYEILTVSELIFNVTEPNGINTEKGEDEVKYLSTLLTKLNSKQDAETGKVLSQNDYTDKEKEKSEYTLNELEQAMKTNITQSGAEAFAKYLSKEQKATLRIYGTESGTGDLSESDSKYHIPVKVSGNLFDFSQIEKGKNVTASYENGVFKFTKLGYSISQGNELLKIKVPVESGKTYTLYSGSGNATFSSSGWTVASHTVTGYWYQGAEKSYPDLYTVYTGGQNRVSFTAKETGTLEILVGGQTAKNVTTELTDFCIYEGIPETSYNDMIWTPYFEPLSYDIVLDEALLNGKWTEKEIVLPKGTSKIAVKTSSPPSKLVFGYIKSLKSIIRDITNAVIALGGSL